MFQDTPQVGWDYTTVYVHIDTATHLVVLYVLVSCVALIVKTGRMWSTMGLFSRRAQRSLEKAADAIQKNDSAKLRAAIEQIGRRAPEAGLREWPDTEMESGSIGNALGSAGRQFARNCQSVARVTRGLKMWIALTPLVFGLYSASELFDLFRSISYQKIAGLSATFGSLESLMSMWQVGLWLTIAYLVAYWHFTVRLDRRRETWAHFVSETTEMKNDAVKLPR
jgi:hypothetical protein